MLNPHFNFYNYGPTQRMVEENYIEAIKMAGVEAYYLPRNRQNIDLLFGEDPKAIFDKAVAFEVFIKNSDAYQGDGEFLSKFGVEVRHGLSIQFAARRWNQIKTEKLIQENSYNLLQETTNTSLPFEVDNIEIEDGNSDNYTITDTQPQMGDIIYIPMMKAAFEIKFVKNEEVFYQFGKLMTYDLNIELFEHSQESFETQVTEINDNVNAYRNIMNEFDMLAENNDTITSENTGIISNEEYNVSTTDTSTDNSIFDSEEEGVVDFSKKSPFVLENSNGKW